MYSSTRYLTSPQHVTLIYSEYLRHKNVPQGWTQFYLNFYSLRSNWIYLPPFKLYRTSLWRFPCPKPFGFSSDPANNPVNTTSLYYYHYIFSEVIIWYHWYDFCNLITMSHFLVTRISFISLSLWLIIISPAKLGEMIITIIIISKMILPPVFQQ